MISAPCFLHNTLTAHYLTLAREILAREKLHVKTIDRHRVPVRYGRNRLKGFLELAGVGKTKLWLRKTPFNDADGLRIDEMFPQTVCEIVGRTLQAIYEKLIPHHADCEDIIFLRRSLFKRL